MKINLEPYINGSQVKYKIDSKVQRTAWLMTILFLMTAAGMIFFQPLEKAVAFSAMDDGLYYPKLAQNIMSRGFCTYDGVTQTNGFHPLWLLVLLPVYGLIQDPWMALRCVYGVILAAQLGALGLLFRIARYVQMTATGLAVAAFILIINIRSFTIFFSFLESPLVLLVLMAYITFCVQAEERRFEKPAYAFVAGLLVGLCFLARLDSFLLPLAYGILLLGHLARHRNRWKRLLLSAAVAASGCLLLVIPYLGWNWMTFGHLQTVSAWQKTASFSPVQSWKIISAWVFHQIIPRVQYILGLNQVPPWVLLCAMGAAGLLGVVYLVTGSRRQKLVALYCRVPEFFLFVGLHSLFIVLAAPFEAAASAWYWVPEIACIALTAGAVLPDWRWRGVSVAVVAVMLITALQVGLYPSFVRRKTMSWAKLEVARFLRQSSLSSQTGAMFDSGVVSYFSQQDFAGLNGLIGDFDHAGLIREKRYAEAMERTGVQFLVLDTPSTILEQLSSFAVYETSIKTKFENFNEPPKPFVVYQGSPAELAAIWTMRYGGKR